MRFGLALPQYDYSLPGIESIGWSQVRDWAVRAEEMGFDSIWLSDHLFLDISKYGGPDTARGAMECWTTIAALTSVTSRVRLGTLVLCNDLRPPSLVAKMAATVDLLSEGRLEIGMGAGWYEPDYRAAGIEFRRAGLRIDRLAEAVQIVRGMLSHEVFSFSGEHYEIKEAYNLPRPVQQPSPPVWVGGKGDRIVETAARYADGFNSVWAWTPEAFGERIALLERLAKEAGRDPSEIRKSVGLYTLGGDDRSQVESRYEAYKRASFGVAKDIPLGDWAADKLCGTPEEIVELVRRFEALGVEEVILGFGLLPFQIADERAVEWFANEVFPLMARGQGA